MNILVLGSEGTLGKAVCNILSVSYNVIKWDIKLSNNMDLRKPQNIDNILPSVDAVVFLAFDVGGSKYNVSSKTFLDNNLQIILNTFDSLSKYPKPLIYTTSTMSNMITNQYGMMKRISEFYVQNLKGVNLKLWNVYGNEEINEKSHVIPDFISQAIDNKSIVMKSDGMELRQFIHCDDFARAVETILVNYDQFKNQTIDLSSGSWNSILEIANIIKTIFFINYSTIITITSGSSNNNHTIQNEPQHSLLNKLWKPQISLYNGIQKLVKDILSYQDNNGRLDQ